MTVEKAIQISFPLYQDLQNYLQAHITDEWAATLLERLQAEAIPVELDQAHSNIEQDEDIEF